MLTSPVDKKEEVEEMDEDAAIAKVVRESCLWVKRAVSNIDVTPSIWLDEVQINKHKKEIVKKVSPSYVCRRCKRPGHHVKQCITNGDRAFDPVVVRGVAGIPRSFTVDLTPEQAQADKTAQKKPDGTYCSIAPRVGEFARYIEPIKQAKLSSFPQHLACLLCKNLIKKPLYFSCCCTASFCTACVMPDQDLGEEHTNCPICNKRSHVNELIPNTGMRAEVLVYIRECNNKKRKALEELESGRKDKLVRK